MTGDEPKSKGKEAKDAKDADGKGSSSKKSEDDTLVATDTVPKEAVLE